MGFLTNRQNRHAVDGAAAAAADGHAFYVAVFRGSPSSATYPDAGESIAEIESIGWRLDQSSTAVWSDEHQRHHTMLLTCVFRRSQSGSAR